MGRRLKQNIKDGIDRRKTGYFSTPDFVADFIGNELLLLNPNGKKVLDPCVGKEELLSVFVKSSIVCEGFDILRLKEDYSSIFNCVDFIQTYIDSPQTLMDQHYNYIVMNPPYNCHECNYIVSNKKILQQYFKIGVHNMSALFLSAAIDISHEGCLIGAIVPDAILTSRSYEKLRLKILNDCTVLELLLCPDDLFRKQIANVSTCILILRKGRGGSSNKTVFTLDRPSSSDSFKMLLESRRFSSVSLDKVVFDDRLIVGPYKISSLLSAYTTLGSLYKCGGGISTGNDKDYTKKIPEDGYTVPFLTNPASSRFRARPNKYICDDYIDKAKSSKSFIIRNKKYLYKDGIAFSSVGKYFSAVFLPADTVTGVNAAVWPPREDILWLLAYMNSSFITYVAKAIYNRGNMTTIRCVQSLPVLGFNESEKMVFSGISQAVLAGDLQIDDAVDRIDQMVFSRLGVAKNIENEVKRFCSDLTHNV